MYKATTFSFYFFLLMCLIVPPSVAAQLVDIPDPNLRAAIETALGKNADSSITATEMATLWHLGILAASASISDLTGLEYATNLTSLRLRDNSISDISPLAANAGLGSGDTVDLRGNRLSALAFNTYIPILQSRGVTVRAPAGVWSVGEPYTVRLIYFLPTDRQPQPDIDTKMDTLIKDVQQFYADQMESHGFGGKTFRFEIDAAGKAVVHYMNGKFTDRYYHNDTLSKVMVELRELFNVSRNIYFIAIDTGVERIDANFCGKGGFFSSGGGRAIIPASGSCFDVDTTAHELGHALGLAHDFRNDAYLMSYGGGARRRLSRCAAEWLNVSRFFNASQTAFNEPTTIQILTTSLAYPPNAISLRFEIADPDGLHQAQLIIPTAATDPASGEKLHECKSLNGEMNQIEFLTTQLTPKAESVSLRVIDVHGNFSTISYPINITDLLPPPKVVSIPDANLAAAVRETLGLVQSDTLMSHAMLELQSFNANRCTAIGN